MCLVNPMQSNLIPYEVLLDVVKDTQKNKDI